MSGFASWQVRHRTALLLLAALFAGAAACYPQQIDPMKKQPKYKVYRENDFFEDHRAMRPLVEGTVPRERQLGDFALTTGRSGPDGGRVDQIPAPMDREDLQQGRKSFEIYCAACHGILGDGNSVPSRKMSLRPPPSLFEFRDRPPGYFFQVMTEGYGYMPSYAELLTVDERWQVVAYVQALFKSQTVPLQQVPEDQRKKLQEERP